MTTRSEISVKSPQGKASVFSTRAHTAKKLLKFNKKKKLKRANSRQNKKNEWIDLFDKISLNNETKYPTQRNYFA
jgi:hypothetical protein